MEYSNSDLTKSTDPKGYSYTYTYDKNHNVTQASSQRNVKYNYTYSKSGSNPLTLDITNSGGTMSLKSAAGYSGQDTSKKNLGRCIPLQVQGIRMDYRTFIPMIFLTGNLKSAKNPNDTMTLLHL